MAPVRKTSVGGKKRYRSGEMKSGPKSTPQFNPTKDSEAQQAKKNIKSSSMIDEIVALEGTQEGLELIRVPASSKHSSKKAVHEDNIKDTTLLNDISSLVKDPGFPPEVPDISSTRGVRLPFSSRAIEKSVSRKKKPLADSAVKPAINKSTISLQVPANLDSESSQLVFEPRPDWHAAVLPDLPSPTQESTILLQSVIESLHQYAKSLLEAENKTYASTSLQSSASRRFMATIMSSGTLSDKVSALTLAVQESPLHTMKAFESLIGLARKRSRGQAVTSLGALKDLLGQGAMLPPHRKLRSFANQQGLLGSLQENNSLAWNKSGCLPGKIQKLHLIVWAFEDWLKSSYFEILKILETWCNDEVEFARARALGYVWELLKEKPEQEANLLRLLINKLGDPEKKIASKASFLLLQLQITHPLMKLVIIKSLESDLLFRPGQSMHAKYYAIITLNQTILSSSERHIAAKLLDIYFSLFVGLLKKPHDLKFATSANSVKLNKKGQIQGGGGVIGKRAQKNADKDDASKHELGEKLISAVLTGVNRSFPFSNEDDATFKAHIDTLFRITHSSNFNTSIQALLLIQQLSSSRQASSDRFYRTLYESLLDPRLLTSSKQVMFLNLLFRSLKGDLNVKRVKAFVKRLLQTLSLHQPPFVCGVLYLVKRLEEAFPSLKALLDHPEVSEDEDEVFVDVATDGEHGQITPPADDQKDASAPISRDSHIYDGRKRDPEHSKAENSCLWEIIPFLMHFHPSVSLFASRLLLNEVMPPKPDLSLHTLSHFLDRFVYRNAKSSTNSTRGTSIMQPLSGGDTLGILLSARAVSKSQAPLNSEAFWKLKAEDVGVDEVFFHKYFSQKGKANAVPKKKSRNSDGETDAGTDGENEDEIWKALVVSKPEVEGDVDDDDITDLSMDDLGFENESVDFDSDTIAADFNAGNTDEMEEDSLDDDPLETDRASNFSGHLKDDDGVPRHLEMQLGHQRKSKLDENPRKAKRRKLKQLPTFASADDYAEILSREEL
ncbi:MAG: hypothetical protein M1829_005764 [Trizodia sp. TS-e1964]|nr:MAG: hypothetical protein M1829_005764 [Trizodia sp. TS-e1964]